MVYLYFKINPQLRKVANLSDARRVRPRVAVVFSVDLDITTIGKDFLHLPNGVGAFIVNFDKYETDGHLNWKTKLVLKKGSDIIMEQYPIMKDYDENYFYYFVPIKNKKYILDLNGDKNYEFAVVVDHGGNAPSTSVVVFSLTNFNSLKVYKSAWYQMENGEEVIWKKEDAPKKCFINKKGNCEYL